ncbi:MAG: GDSL-type esterase/lipase family protein [Mangrovibacterium sp.]
MKIPYNLLFAFLLTSVFGYSQDKVHIACVGDGITDGAKIENREVNSYPARLAFILGEKYNVRNFGRSGATLLRKGNLPYWDTNEYRQALAFNPDWVFINLGTNDSKPVNRIHLDEYVSDYKDLIASFRQLSSHPRVVLLLPVPVFSADTTGITASVVRNKVLPMARQVAYETGCEVINLYDLMIESQALFPNKVHPNANGAIVIAKRINELVKMKSVPSFCLAEVLTPTAKTFNFYGFQGFGFTFRDRDAKVVIPKNTAPGCPWVWRTRFWGHEPQADIALLERGFHIVYCDVAELFGNETALSIWDDFYQFLTDAGLAKKAVMEGMSRGGIYVYRWAERYPERVAAIYADAPVLDLKSWPGGKGLGKGSPETWEIFKKDFGFKSEEEAMTFKGNPLDLTEKIAKAGFPMLHVVGDADDVVPVSENTELFEQKIKEAGGFIKVIHKPGVGHHPHSLPNPQPIVDFILMATDYRVSQTMIPVPSPAQLRWHQYERIMFLHFAPNTWTGLGQDDNSLPLPRIKPDKLDTDQWCRVAHSWGAKMIIFVAKHSGGFCWWQTSTTDYGVKNIPWQNGKGDVLANLSASCDKYGLDLGVYIYPGDKNWGGRIGQRRKD